MSEKDKKTKNLGKNPRKGGIIISYKVNIQHDARREGIGSSLLLLPSPGLLFMRARIKEGNV